MLSILHNPASMASASRLRQNSRGLAGSLMKLSSGKRINAATDDAAGLGVAVNLETRTGSLRAAVRNANDAISIVQVIDEAMGTTVDLLQRMRLAVQSSSETLADEERSFVEDEFTALLDQMGQLSQNTEWNNTPLLNGTTMSMDVQVGVNNSTDDRIELRLPSLAALHGAMSALSVSTSTVAQQPYDFDIALGATNNVRSVLGAKQTGSSIQHLQVSEMALSSASSQILDTDYAVETSRMSKLQIMQQAGTASLVQAKSVSQSVLSLL